jgi:hypothetical protein
MASNSKQGDSNHGRGGAASGRPPEWADGLKQLYDSVVEEDLPDAFKDLLDRLDGIDTGPPAAADKPSSGDRSPPR